MTFARGRTEESFDDDAFLERLRRRDPEAMRQVVGAYLPQVVRAARGAGFDASRADDIAQATFLTFVEVIPRFKGRSRVRTYLFGILYNKIKEARRGLGRDRTADAIDDVMEKRFSPDGRWLKPPRPIDMRVHDTEVGDHIEECLDAVPAKQRMAFVLREIEEMDTKEMCKVLGVSRTNLGVLLYRARNRLRECLEDKGVGI